MANMYLYSIGLAMTVLVILSVVNAIKRIGYVAHLSVDCCLHFIFRLKHQLSLVWLCFTAS